MKLTAYAIFSGENFDPFGIEKNSHLKLKNKIRKGEFGKKGRFKESQSSEGSAILLIDNKVDPLRKLLALISDNHDLLKTYHVKEIDITLEIGYTEQCNWEISKEEIQKLGELNLGISFSCYKLTPE